MQNETSPRRRRNSGQRGRRSSSPSPSQRPSQRPRHRLSQRPRRSPRSNPNPRSSSSQARRPRPRPRPSRPASYPGVRLGCRFSSIRDCAHARISLSANCPRIVGHPARCRFSLLHGFPAMLALGVFVAMRDVRRLYGQTASRAWEPFPLLIRWSSRRSPLMSSRHPVCAPVSCFCPRWRWCIASLSGCFCECNSSGIPALGAVRGTTSTCSSSPSYAL